MPNCSRNTKKCLFCLFWGTTELPVFLILSKDHYAEFQKRLMSEFQETLVSDRPMHRWASMNL